MQDEIGSPFKVPFGDYLIKLKTLLWLFDLGVCKQLVLGLK
jgi:hypothetical protein